MGIGILAAGGSIPEATSGIINARNGKDSLGNKLSHIMFSCHYYYLQAKDRWASVTR